MTLIILIILIVVRACIGWKRPHQTQQLYPVVKPAHHLTLLSRTCAYLVVKHAHGLQTDLVVKHAHA